MDHGGDMTFLSGLFGGGGGKEKKLQKEQEQVAAVTNDRQLAEVNRQAALTETTRKAPRGQRLFSDGPASAPRTLGA